MTEQLDRLAHEVRYSFRMMRKNLGFTFVAIITLALGIGANTAIFSVVNSVLLHPLPFKDPGQLVLVREKIPMFGAAPISMPPVDVLGIRDNNRVFAESGAFEEESIDLTTREQAERLPAVRVTADVLPMIGAQPAMGRVFTADEDRRGEPVTMLGYAVWQRSFGGDPSIVGKTIQLDRKPYTVIGVMPKGFAFPPQMSADYNAPQVWVPMSFTPQELAGRDWYDFDMLARLKPGVTAQQAESQVSAISAGMYTWMSAQRPELKVSASVVPLANMVVQKSRTLLWLLLGAIFFVLLIACANVATLLLARSAVRRREVAYRIALGATRARLVRAALVEDLLLACLGGAAGLILARWGVRGLLAILPASIPRTSEVHMDWSVLAFAFGLSALTGILFGIVPAISLTHVNLNEALKEGSRGQIGASFWKGTRGLLVAGQVALAVVLLTGGSLLVRSFQRVQEVDPGFQSRNLLTLSTSLPQAEYVKGAAISSFYQKLQERVQDLPDTASAGFGTSLPMAGGWHRIFEAEGHPAPSGKNMQLIANTAVLGDYFRTLGMPLKAGRFFNESDKQDSAPVVLISEGMARQYWPGEDAIGKRMRFSASLPWMNIVGIVADVKESGLDEASSPHTYQPYLQLGDEGIAAVGRRMRMVVKTKADPLSAVNDVRAQVHALDPQLPVANVRSMQQIVETSLVPRRFNTLMFSGFGCVGLLLAAAGIYGIIAYSVSQREQELGLRIALGARRNDLLWLTLRDGLRVALIGIAVGLPAAYGFARLLSGLLYGVRPTDPATFATIVLSLLVAALLASFLPARRATRLDAMAALRNE